MICFLTLFLKFIINFINRTFGWFFLVTHFSIKQFASLNSMYQGVEIYIYMTFRVRTLYQKSQKSIKSQSRDTKCFVRGRKRRPVIVLAILTSAVFDGLYLKRAGKLSRWGNQDQSEQEMKVLLSNTFFLLFLQR